MSENEPRQFNVDEMTPQQCLEALWNLMNKAANKGTFNIDESYVLKIIFAKLSRFTNETATKTHDLSDVLNKNEDLNKVD